MNLTAQLKLHWVNGDDGEVSSSTVCSGSFPALVCTATDDVPVLAVPSGGVGQCSTAGVNVDDSLSPCFEFLSPMAANPFPVGVARSHLQHSSQARLEPISQEPNPPSPPWGCAQEGPALPCHSGSAHQPYFNSKHTESRKSLNFIVHKVTGISASC